MQLRGLAPTSQRSAEFARYFQRSPELLDCDAIRQSLRHLLGAYALRGKRQPMRLCLEVSLPHNFGNALDGRILPARQRSLSDTNSLLRVRF
jgi:hypothetical protein